MRIWLIVAVTFVMASTTDADNSKTLRDYLKEERQKERPKGECQKYACLDVSRSGANAELDEEREHSQHEIGSPTQRLRDRHQKNCNTCCTDTVACTGGYVQYNICYCSVPEDTVPKGPVPKSPVPSDIVPISYVEETPKEECTKLVCPDSSQREKMREEINQLNRKNGLKYNDLKEKYQQEALKGYKEKCDKCCSGKPKCTEGLIKSNVCRCFADKSADKSAHSSVDSSADNSADKSARRTAPEKCEEYGCSTMSLNEVIGELFKQPDSELEVKSIYKRECNLCCSKVKGCSSVIKDDVCHCY